MAILQKSEQSRQLAAGYPHGRALARARSLYLLQWLGKVGPLLGMPLPPWQYQRIADYLLEKSKRAAIHMYSIDYAFKPSLTLACVFKPLLSK